MNCSKSNTPLKCDIEIPMSCDPSNCDAVSCGCYADIICQHCGLALCSRCEYEFPCPHSQDGKHAAESEFDLYRGHVQPDYRTAATYRKAVIEAAKHVDFRSAVVAIFKGVAL